MKKNEYTFKAPSENPLFESQTSKPYIPTNSVVFCSPNVLDGWASSRLEKIIEYMLKMGTDIEQTVQQILVDSGLINFDGELINDGHQFVLWSARDQLWRIVNRYLSESADLISSLKFLLKLGSLQFTRGYLFDHLNQTEKNTLSTICLNGICFHRR